MSTAVAVGGVIAFQKLIEQVTVDLYAHFKGEYQGKLEKISALKNISALNSKIEEVSKVKTIWQTDKSVQLSSFYCDTHIKVAGERKIVKQVSDLNIDGNILIEGIAGQGKSIFMRHLCIAELESGIVIPVFIELRRLTSENMLLSMIHSKLKELGFDIDNDIFKFLCNTGRMLFLLDGFDEVPDKMQISVVNEVEEITNTYRGIKLIVSSRPESGIEFLPSFSVAKVDYVKNDEYKDIINKLSEDPEFAKSLIDRVQGHKSEIKDLLCTPLMITLLILTYKAYQKVPDQLSDFFESMFHLMLQRHDGTKPGYRRERRCDLNDMDYQRAFEALCFVTKEKGQSFKVSVLNDCAAKALTISKFNADPQKYIQDVNRITCLIVYEGKEYRFLHKSIQEYFAASFIKYKPDSVATKFYSKMTVDGYKWHQELLYLEEIDSYRFCKYLVLPLCRNFMVLSGKSVTKKINTKVYDEILKYTYIVKPDTSAAFWYSYGTMLRLLLDTSRCKVDSRSILLTSLHKNKTFTNMKDDISVFLTELSGNFKYATLKSLRDNNICVEAIDGFADEVFNLIHSSAIDVQKYLKKEEKTDFMDYILDTE